MKLRHALFAADMKFKKKKKYAEDESDLDEDVIADHEDQLKAKELEKVEKKFQKDNEKLVEDGKEALSDDVLKQRLKEVDAEFKRLKKERGTGKAQLKKERPTDKIEEAIDKLDEKIKTFKLQMEDREAGKEVALGTRFAPWHVFILQETDKFESSVRSIIWIQGMCSAMPYVATGH